jgi:hypothetical protein
VTATDEILTDADAALTAAIEGVPRARLDAMTKFMLSFERLAREVAGGAATWDDLRPWAVSRAERLCSAHDALTDWEFEMGQIFYHGGEEDAERALRRRSQHALARELFRDTPADEMLAAYEDEEVDREFRDEAERIAIDALDWVPPSHVWWRRRQW